MLGSGAPHRRDDSGAARSQGQGLLENVSQKDYQLREILFIVLILCTGAEKKTFIKASIT